MHNASSEKRLSIRVTTYYCWHDSEEVCFKNNFTPISLNTFRHLAHLFVQVWFQIGLSNMIKRTERVRAWKHTVTTRGERSKMFLSYCDVIFRTMNCCGSSWNYVQMLSLQQRQSQLVTVIEYRLWAWCRHRIFQDAYVSLMAPWNRRVGVGRRWWTSKFNITVTGFKGLSST